MSTKKYRPYFTVGELEEIVSSLKTSPTPRRLQIAKYLEAFLFQIRLGVRKENHSLAPTIYEKLELETPVPIASELTGEAAYQKWIIHPNQCTSHEIECALEYAYTNNLMSPQQEVEYETQKGL